MPLLQAKKQRGGLLSANPLLAIGQGLLQAGANGDNIGLGFANGLQGYEQGLRQQQEDELQANQYAAQERFQNSQMARSQFDMENAQADRARLEATRQKATEWADSLPAEHPLKQFAQVDPIATFTLQAEIAKKQAMPSDLQTKYAELKQAGVDPNSPQGQKYLGMYVDPNGSGSASPYFQFLPGADGYLVGNARTGQIAPGMVNGQRAVPGALDPSLQGQITAAKKGGELDAERSGKNADRTRSAGDALGLLDEAESLLKGGATGSLAGTGIDIAAGALGYTAPGAAEAASLRTIGGQLVAKMPRMEGPQSNMDVKLYRDMAGQLDDSTLPTQTRLAALAQIRKLNEKYAAPELLQRPAAPRKRFNPETGKIEAY